MTDPIEKQRPLLVWGDHGAVCDARRLLEDHVVVSSHVCGRHYCLCCAYLEESIDPVLDAKLRALVSRVQVSLSRT